MSHLGGRGTWFLPAGAAGRDVGTPGYRGCAFPNAAAEYPDTGHPVHELCTAHVTSTAAVLHKLAGAALGTPAVITAVSLAKEIVRSASPARQHNQPR